MSRAIWQWGLYGALFGVCFPVLAVGLRAWEGGGADAALDAVIRDHLLWIIFTAPVFLGAFAALGGRQQDRVQDLNAGLEKTVAERTQDLRGALLDVQRVSAEQQSLLGGLEVGLACFDREGALLSARSAALERILPGSEAITDIDTLLEQYAGIPREETAFVRELLWGEDFESPFPYTVDLITRRFTVEGRVLETCYKPMLDAEGALSQVLVQILDKTDAVLAEQEQARASARIRRLTLAAEAPEAFERFRLEAEALFAECARQGCPLDVLKRTLHTLKGNCRLFGFEEVGLLVHQAEDRLAEGEHPDAAVLKALFREQVGDVRQVLGLERMVGKVALDRQRLTDLTQQLSPDLAEALRDLVRQTPEQLIGHHARATECLADRRGLSVSVRVLGDTVTEEEIAPFHEALTHILTNAVIHAARPGLPLTVVVRVQRAERVVLEVQDDGAGVQIEKLTRKAVSSGLRSASWAKTASLTDKLALVFVGGLSAQDEVSETAGRGMGLSAVQVGLVALGGQVLISSCPGEGTLFVLYGPVLAPPAQVERASA